MKSKIYDLEGKEVKDIELPFQFNEEIREDLIKKSVLTILSNKRQKYGASKEAGKGYSVRVSKRRHDYRGSYGYGISRVPRKVMSRRGTRFNWTGAFSPGTVGGRRAHPPKAEKDWTKKMNIKERRKALRSAISASAILNLVQARGHNVSQCPIVIEKSIETLSKTKDAKNLLEKLGLSKELIRCSKKKVRAGKGKSRGRKYKKKKGPLIVLSKYSNATKSFRNLNGVEVVSVKRLNANLLAPGGDAGRLVVWSEQALDIMQKERLFS